MFYSPPLINGMTPEASAIPSIPHPPMRPPVKILLNSILLSWYHLIRQIKAMIITSVDDLVSYGVLCICLCIHSISSNLRDIQQKIIFWMLMQIMWNFDIGNTL